MHLAWWLSWLERRPVTAEVVGSNPIRVVSTGCVLRDIRSRVCLFLYNKCFGWVPEWPKGADCKSVVDDFGGSNPPPSTKAEMKILAFSLKGVNVAG